MHLTASRCGFNIYPLQLRQVVEQDNKNFSSFDIASPRWFKENYLVIFAICTIIGWKVFGYNIIVMLAAMVAVPKEMIDGSVEFVENTGNLKTATLRLATGEIFYLQDSNQSIALEAVHGFDFDWSNVCLFDAESGENLEKRN